MSSSISRRQAVAGLAVLTAAPGVAQAPPSVAGSIVRRNDESVERLLRMQVTDPAQPRCGAYPDDVGLYHPGSAGSVLHTCAASFLHPASRFHRDALLVARMRLAAGFLERAQSPQGNVDYATTNFNSPPDTAFVAQGVATAASIARRYGAPEVARLMEPFLRKAGAGMAEGGVHTPNHRWVLCAALAQIHDLMPNAAYVRRIDQWLAEGIDIDEDGQYTERSTGVYNAHIDRSLVVMAAKLKRSELLAPVRRNLDSMLYLLHPGYEVVTEISRRQDLNTRADMGGYWFPLRYLAVRDGNGRYETIARHFAETHANLGWMMEYPSLADGGPSPVAVPDNYEREFPAMKMARIRRGPVSATLLLGGASRFFSLRRGACAIEAVRFASAFFGKGQFIPQRAEKRGGSYVFTQSLEAGYMQPLDPPHKVRAGEWGRTRGERRQTEMCRLEQSAVVTELPAGFRLRLAARGLKGVPVAVEIGFRRGGKLEGCVPAPKVEGGWILAEGRGAYRVGGDAIRFGPGLREHSYTQLRGAEGKLGGESVYLCGYTPFEHTVEFEVG